MSIQKISCKTLLIRNLLKRLFIQLVPDLEIRSRRLSLRLEKPCPNNIDFINLIRVAPGYSDVMPDAA